MAATKVLVMAGNYEVEHNL